ncbi:MAG: Sapep family Mn(2+)-dependent dipeptidase [Emergencia sp.]
MIDTLKKLIAVPSITGTDEVKQALEVCLEECESLGFKTKNLDGRLGYAEIGEGKELMGILCHLDVVPPGDGWTKEPFNAAIEDGRIYGRGVMDDKGPAAAAMHAMRDVLDSGRILNKRVRIIFGTMEESGEWDDMDYYKTHEEIPSFGFTPDADFPAIYGEKGILMVSLSTDAEKTGFVELSGGDAPNMVAGWAKGVLTDGTAFDEKGKAAHGSTPEEGINAVTMLMEKAADKDCSFAKLYMEKFGWCLDGSLCGIGFTDDASGGLSFNVGQAELKDGKLKLAVDIRYPVTFSEEQVLTALKNNLATEDIDVEVITSMKSVYMDRNGPVITKLMEAYREITGDDTLAQLMGGGTYARAMDNIVAFGPVFPGSELTEHKADEWILLEDLEKARKIYRIAIEKLACN